MSDINVDDFFKDAAIALIRLYRSFPRRHALFVDEIYGTDELDEFGMHSDRYLACYSTLIWLGEEGYLRYADSIRQDAIDQAVLTARCFTLLCAPATNLEPIDVTDLPESVRIEKSTNIHRLQLAVQQRSSSRIRAAMLNLMDEMRGA